MPGRRHPAPSGWRGRNMTHWTITLHNKIIRQFAVDEGETVTIGRGRECQVVIDNTAISRKHVSIFQSSGICFVSDLGSTNGTFVNGKKVERDEPVTDGDVVTFGKFALAMADNAVGAAAVSSSAAPLDLDDETIFVGGRAPAVQQQKKFTPRSGGPKLTVLQGGEPPELAIGGKSSVKIGKDPGCDIRVGGFLVAKAQCYIIKRDKGYYLVPQRSWAGTYVNGVKISSETRLRPGDVIKIRGNTIRFD